jgi:PAS domain-containing protein
MAVILVVEDEVFTRQIIAASDIVETVPSALIVLDRNLNITSANRAFYQTFRTSADRTEGCNIRPRRPAVGYPGAAHRPSGHERQIRTKLSKCVQPTRLNHIVPIAGGLPELRAFRCFFCDEATTTAIEGAV